MLQILLAAKESRGIFSGTRVSSHFWSKGYSSMNPWCRLTVAPEQILFNFSRYRSFLWHCSVLTVLCACRLVHFVHYVLNTFPVESAARLRHVVVSVNPNAAARGPQCAEEHLVVYLTFIVCEAFICTKITAYEGNLALSLKRHKRLWT